MPTQHIISKLIRMRAFFFKKKNKEVAPLTRSVSWRKPVHTHGGHSVSSSVSAAGSGTTNKSKSSSIVSNLRPEEKYRTDSRDDSGLLSRERSVDCALFSMGEQFEALGDELNHFLDSTADHVIRHSDDKFYQWTAKVATIDIDEFFSHPKVNHKRSGHRRSSSSCGSSSKSPNRDSTEAH